MPKPENCVPFFDAADARGAGYRPCKHCRPDRDAVGSKAEEKARVIRYGLGASPIGFALLGMTDRGLCGLFLLDDEDPTPGLARLRSDFPGAQLVEDPEAIAPMLDRVRSVIEARNDDLDIPLDLHGTPFQLRVWTALRAIPAGSTRTYGDLAWQLGLPPGAARAVGAACGANPVGLIVPCHRAVGAGGRLCGYRWGLARKRALLDRENREAQFLRFEV
jgi:AraC family transcriptional regulator of adaptative response/methylated-DNA-[protein]-cysteine methyltransferase